MSDYLEAFKRDFPEAAYFTTVKDQADIVAVCRIFGCTNAQAKAQYTKNAAQLRQMAAHPKRANGGKLHGFTAADLAAKAAEFDRKGR